MTKKKAIESVKDMIKPRGGDPQPSDPKPLPAPAEKPTDEMLRRLEFPYGPVQTEMGIRIGAAYRRRPLFETMALRGPGLSLADLEALRYYRAAHDRSDRSATKSCLNVGVGSATGRNSAEVKAISTTPAITDARMKLDICERAIGSLLDTMRAFVLHDQSFSEIAMERFGNRKQSWIVDDVPREKVKGVVDQPVTRKVYREKLVPKSGRHREIIRQEFHDGLKRLRARLSGHQPIEGSFRAPPAAEVAKSSTPASDVIEAGIHAADRRGLRPGALWVSAVVASAVSVEQGGTADDVPVTFAGIPIDLRESWPGWAWLLVEGGTVGSEELWVEEVDDGQAMVRRGACAPAGVYRLWGSPAQVDTVLLRLHEHNPGVDAFPTVAAACAALDDAGRSILDRLLESEIAA